MADKEKVSNVETGEILATTPIGESGQDEPTQPPVRGDERPLHVDGVLDSSTPVELPGPEDLKGSIEEEHGKGKLVTCPICQYRFSAAGNA